MNSKEYNLIELWKIYKIKDTTVSIEKYLF